MRDDALAVMAKINKAMGENTVLLASDMVIPRRFTSGSLSLDVALGGGWPANQWVELIGPESSGKTVCALKTVAANQREDPEFTTLWVAAEHYNTAWAESLGVDNSRVQVIPTQQMELALELIIQATASQAFDCIVLDSYPALVPAEEDEKAMDEFSVAVGAKTFSKFWRKGGKAIKRMPDGTERPMVGIIINQFRDKIGGFARFGVPQTSPGGHAKDYAYFVRLQLARKEWITEKRPSVKDPVNVGQVITMRTIKNKAAPPQQTANIDFYFRDAPVRGFRRGEYNLGKEYVQMAIAFRVIRKSGGGFYSYHERKWRGEETVITDILAEPELREEIRAEVLEAARDPRNLDILEDL